MKVDDPALVLAILADGQSERMNRWRAWPVLLGLTLQSSAWASASFNAATGSLSGRLDGLPVCTPPLASAVVEASPSWNMHNAQSLSGNHNLQF